MKRFSFLILILALMLAVSGCSNYQFKATTDIEVQDFEHVNHRNETISLDDLKGKPWLAMFIFTNCATVCPPMTFNMTDVQAALEDEGVEDYHIVAFSVDPAVDTPEVLTDYLSYYNVVDESKWHALTGYDPLYMQQFAKQSFNSHVQNDPSSDQVIHMSYFYLVSPEGVTVKSYDGNTDVPIDTIVADVKALIES